MWSINGWRLLTIMIPTTITAISAACLHIFANLQVMWFNGLFVAASTCNFLITPHELGAKMHPRRSYEFFSVQIECIPVLGSRKSTQRWSLSCLAGFTFWLFIPGNHYKPQNRGWSPALFCALRGILCPEATGRPCPGLSWVGWGGERGWPPLDGISFPPAPEAGFLANPDRQRVPSGAKSIFGFFLSASLRSEFMGFPRGLLPLKLPTRVFLPFLPGKKKSQDPKAEQPWLQMPPAPRHCGQSTRLTNLPSLPSWLLAWTPVSGPLPPRGSTGLTIQRQTLLAVPFRADLRSYHLDVFTTGQPFSAQLPPARPVQTLS